MITINAIYIYLISALILGFTLGFISGIFISNKLELKLEKILGFIFFIIWVGLHVYGFLNSKEVPIIFDVVGAGSAGAMLGIKISEEMTQIIISKFKGGQ